MLGIGGGVVYVLVFTTYLNHFLPDSVAGDIVVRLIIANAAFALVFAGLSGSLKNYRMRNFYLKPVVLIGIFGSLASISVTWLLSLTTAYDKQKFAILFILFMIPIIIKMLTGKKHDEPDNFLPDISWWGFSGLGIVAGAVMALSGLGGGFVMVPVLHSVLRYPIRKAISISLGVIGINSLFLTLYNLFLSGEIDAGLNHMYGAIVFPMVLPVVAGVLAGAPLGVIFAHKLKPLTLKILFLGFVLLVIIKLIITMLWNA